MTRMFSGPVVMLAVALALGAGAVIRHWRAPAVAALHETNCQPISSDVCFSGSTSRAAIQVTPLSALPPIDAPAH